MINILMFLFFIVYSTSVFFIKNEICIFVFIFINILIMLLKKISFIDVLKNIKKLIPFILFTFVINCILEEIYYSFIISIKLIIVCNATFIYSRNITVSSFSKMIKDICVPLKILKINTDEIEILVSISLSILPILKRDLREMKYAMKAKNMKMSLSNIKIMFSKYCLNLLIRVDKLEKSLLAKNVKI